MSVIFGRERKKIVIVFTLKKINQTFVCKLLHRFFQNLERLFNCALYFLALTSIGIDRAKLERNCAIAVVAFRGEI